MKSTSASDSGWGSVNITTSNFFGSSWRRSAKSSEAGRAPGGATPSKGGRGGQGPSRRDAFEGEAERRRRTIGLMQPIKARRAGDGIDGRHEAARLDHENRRLIWQRQRIAALRVGDGDIPAVRDEHIGHAWPPCRRTIILLENDARH